jgi:hypothetical protein
MTARTRLLLATTLLLAAAGAAQAQSYRAHGPVELSIVDRDAGYELPQYPARGQLWVPGTPGHRYAVRLTNRSPERVLVVLSVDGVNAISGQTADTGQGGYVLEPYQTTEVAGWRKSMRDVAQFYFADFGDSYATRTGRPHDVGVIGVAVFEEARRLPPPRVYGPRPYGDREERATSDAAPAAPVAAPEMAKSRAQEIGTGHGRREYAPVSRTGFVRASRHPAQVVELRYDDERALAARGIVPRRGGRYSRDEPRAFPGGFVPDPPRGW